MKKTSRVTLASSMVQEQESGCYASKGAQCFRTSRNEKGRRSGFTIAEILVALFILCSSMFILSELQVKSMKICCTPRTNTKVIFLYM